MQALSQWDAQGDTSEEGLRDLFDSLLPESQHAVYAGEVVRAFWANRSAVDRCIATAAEHWSLSRIGVVDRNVLRVAVTELLTTDVPPKAVVNEAIEIAREYGGEESPRFVNGVLDRILKEIEGETR